MNRTAALFVAAGVVALDQCSKSAVAHSFVLSESRPIVAGLFSLTYVQNTGGAFGILPGSGVVLVVTGFLVALGIVAALLRTRSEMAPLLVFAAGLPLGGTVGNLIDRIRQGYVVDFFDVYAGVHHWPVFNVADSSICVGAGLLALWLSRKHETASETPAGARTEG